VSSSHKITSLFPRNNYQTNKDWK